MLRLSLNNDVLGLSPSFIYLMKIEEFYFPDIPYQPYPVHLVSSSGRLTNFKSIIYPSASSAKRYTRNKQLKHRSLQAKIFDSLINIGYFDPLIVYREFPVPVQNCYRLQGQKRLYYICDYYFPTLKLAVELDSDYHDNQVKDTDEIRDRYLKEVHGVSVFRIRDFQKSTVQKTKFLELRNLMKSMVPLEKPEVLIFTTDLCKFYSEKSNP